MTLYRKKPVVVEAMVFGETRDEQLACAHWVRDNGGTHTAAAVRSQYGRQRGRCYWCGKKVPWGKKHVDHVVPLALGGSNGPENLVVSCVRCNARKGAKHPMDFAGRML